MPFQADFMQSCRVSISKMAQCIETQLKPNESSGKDLQIRSDHFTHQVAPSWCNLRHKVHVQNCFSLNLLSPGHLSFNYVFSFPEKLTIRSQWNFTCMLKGRVWIAVQNVIDLHRLPWPFKVMTHDPVKSYFQPYFSFCWEKCHQMLAQEFCNCITQDKVWQHLQELYRLNINILKGKWRRLFTSKPWILHWTETMDITTCPWSGINHKREIDGEWRWDHQWREEFC